jgi:hypothetical protein
MAIRARSPSSFDVSISDCTFRAPTHTRLFHWRRIGLATFHPYRGVAFDGVDNKDASLFSTLVPDLLGRPAIALVYRPLFPGTRPEEKALHSALDSQDIDRECIWISYSRVGAKDDGHRLNEFVAHHKLACPIADWERLKIGGGAPPSCVVTVGCSYITAFTIWPRRLQPGSSCVIPPARWRYRGSIPTKLSTVLRSPSWRQEGRQSVTGRSMTSCFPAALIDATISALPSASTCIMAWRIIGSALRVSRRLRRYPGASKC